MKTLVLTGADAAMSSIADLTSANHRAYAMRHGYEFERVTKYPSDCHPSWHKLALLRERLPRYEQILWLDADAVITNPGIRVENIAPGFCGLVVSTDWTHPAPDDAIKHFSLGNFIISDCQQSAELLRLASLRTEWANVPLWEQQAIQEEYRANPGIRDSVQILPRRILNAVPATPTTTGPEPWEPGDFLCHMTFLPNETRVEMFPRYDIEGLRLELRLPDWHETGMCADVRHIACLREICQGAEWKHALEVGVWTGCSTVAFLDFIGESIDTFSACDVGFTDEFWRVIRGHDVQLIQKPSVEVLGGGGFDLVFLDGDHSLETGRDEARLILETQPRCVVAHDVNSMNVGFGNCEGPAHLLQQLQRDGWTIWRDQKDRAGEMTRRGFIAATKDRTLFPVLERAFALTCY